MSLRPVDERVKDGIYCVVVDAECDTCHAKKTFFIPETEWLTWTGGVLIQNAMPSLPKEDRELIISGTCGPCFNALFAEDDDE